MAKEERPLSENIGKYDAGEYYVTAGIWRTRIEHSLFDTFEIGIRHLPTGKFTLLQSEKYNYQSVQEVANAIAHLLRLSCSPYTEHYTPEWCQEYMT